jgi:methylenetetrahydrofolate reductase (NADPH)
MGKRYLVFEGAFFILNRPYFAPMRIAELVKSRVASGTPIFSAEFFPPKNETGLSSLWQSVEALSEFNLDFVSVTYGAGGSTQDRSLEVTRKIVHDFKLRTLAHLTCVSKTAAELDLVVSSFVDAGATDILALRGDPPTGIGSTWTKTVGGYSYASELVEALTTRGDVGIAVAAFPEGHPESKDLAADIDVLKKKQTLGANFAITNLFFTADRYFDLISKANAAGIDIPILPGLMPVTNLNQIERFASMTGAEFPADLASQFHDCKDDEAVRRLGIQVASALAEELLAGGAPGIHLYTLNKSSASEEILRSIKAK